MAGKRVCIRQGQRFFVLYPQNPEKQLRIRKKYFCLRTMKKKQFFRGTVEKKDFLC